MPLGAASKPTRGVGRLLDLFAGEPSKWGWRTTTGSSKPSLNKRGYALVRVGVSSGPPHHGGHGGRRCGRG
jgi:hypothetical protein